MSWFILAGFAAEAIAPARPRLQVQAMDDARVQLFWPAEAQEFALEEAENLSWAGLWRATQATPTLSGNLYSLIVPATSAQHFFRLRYRPSALLSTNPVVIMALVNPSGSNFVAGQPYPIEVRASFNAVLAGVAFRISASGPAEAMLTGRSADPGQPNGLMFVSATSQQPFENGLPASLKDGGALEVLLGTGQWPFDGVPPGEDVVLERLEITPQSTGELTISLAAAEAVTSRWAKDGAPFASVSLDPWRSTVTVGVADAAKPAGLGTIAEVPSAGQSGRVRSLEAVRSSKLQAQAVLAITPNADGQGGVDVADLVYVRARLGLDPALPGNASADVNQDKKIDLLDLVAVRNRLSPPDNLGPQPQVRLNEVAPYPATGEAPWVELECTRIADEFSSAPELRNGAQEVLLAPWAVSIPASLPFIVIVFDGEKPIEYLGDPQAPTGVRVHVPKPGVGSIFNPTNDQCLLYLEGQLVDSVAWGPGPERSATLNTRLRSIPAGGSIGRDGYEQDRWVRFAKPTPGAENGLPTPLAFFPVSSGGVLEGESTSFSWVDPRYSSVAYELEVDEAVNFQTPLIRTLCSGPGYTQTPGLPVGKYSWRVRPVEGESKGPWSDAQALEVIEAPTSSSAAHSGLLSAKARGAPPVKYRSIPSLTRWIDSPYKDSPMLCLECLQDEGEHPWDSGHSPLSLCPHEVGHGVTAIAAALNHYYGGSMKQDEINFGVFGGEVGGPEGATPPEGDLGHGQVPEDVKEVLQVALGVEDVVTWSLDIFEINTWGTYTVLIDLGSPWVAEQLPLRNGSDTGPVLAIGYLETRESGNWRRKIVFVSPFLPRVAQMLDQDALVPAKVKWTFPNVPDGYRQAPHVDPDLFRDTDGDGLYDFDEDRFETLKTKRDSDGDGIEDKTEIWSYQFGHGMVTRTPDPDGDGLRAELDPDTDNDGCPDGDEDKNHDGTLGVYQAGSAALWKDTNETDPFWVDEFKVTLSAQQTTLRFKECTRLEVKVTDKSGDPIQDGLVRLVFDPLIGSFGAPGAGGVPVTTAFIQTDKEGKASTEFCAQETKGTVKLTARYKPCAQGKESKAELDIEIHGYDWIFAVQEKAVLTGPTLTNEYTITTRPEYSGMGGYGDADTRKDAGFQKVSGHFEYPNSKNPGLWIERVAVTDANAQLSIDGEKVGQAWVRTNELQNPTSWEVSVAVAKLEVFPRYLLVTAIGASERKMPLVWWSSCGMAHRRNRNTYYAAAWGRGFLRTYDYHRHNYEFYFGDGDRYGEDSAGTWPKEQHTAVSFIPVEGLPGREVGTFGGQGFPPADWYNPLRSVVCEEYGNFSYKNLVTWTPPAPWTSREITNESYLMQEDLTNAGPLPPIDFLKALRFKRDYIGNELMELRQRKLEAPDYEIQMLTSD